MFNLPQEKLRNMIKHDAWSDFVNNTFSSIGITPAVRDAAQPAVNQLQNQVFQQNTTQVPPATSGVFGTLMPDNQFFIADGELTTVSKVLIGVVFLVLVYFLVKVRK